MNEIKWCICGQRATELHHIVFRSKSPSLINCKMNLIPLCQRCHYEIHHGKGHKLDKLLKLQLQNNLEILFNKEYLSEHEIKEVLRISDKALGRLLKTVEKKKDKYVRESVIRACLGGKLIIEGDI